MLCEIIYYLPIPPDIQSQLAACTAGFATNGVALLLVVFTSPVTGVVVALNVGVVPTIVALGVTGTLNVLLPPAAIGPAFVQVTEGVLVAHVQPLLVKLVGAVTPVGKVMVVVIGLVVAPVPIFATVIGKLLACPATKTGLGCPIVVVKSGGQFGTVTVTAVVAAPLLAKQLVLGSRKVA